jgi:ATP-dependent DNA helicase RecQ
MPVESDRFAELLTLIDRHWGFRALRPLQEQAMAAVLQRRDSLVVMPTGGGKSLCFQAPALLHQAETTVVISPLIALMKDQVDGLRAAGVPARQIDSTLTDAQRVQTANELRAGRVRLLFVSPERLMMPNFQRFLQQLGVRTFAIDEAHCISHWGHDFRPEYRQLSTLRDLFPQATLHGYTATATEQVRNDIVAQLGLRDPELLVGNFDRPNLCYRVVPRTRLLDQVVETLKKHQGEAGIIYCIRRKDVDALTADLRALGHQAVPYHAGMMPEERKAAQDAFRSEKCDLVVATVAFGMGIDRSNVRFVLHAGMPKSLEHYQQEAGRAGRDGLEAECVLLHSMGDFMTWKSVLEKSAQENEVAPDFLPNAMAHLNEMSGYCRGATCRHRALVEHFGQAFEPLNCGACDLCLGEVEMEPQSQEIARKVLSCVARVNESFGVGHVVAVLRGEASEKIVRYGHDKLSTHGLLKEHTQAQVRDWAYQLLDLGLLDQSEGDYPVLKLNALSWEVMRNQRQAQLRQTAKRVRSRRAANEDAGWEGVDRDLFERLRVWRREAAEARGWPPFAVFSDNTLRELARSRPSTLEGLRNVYGVGDAKLQAFGDDLIALIVPFCRDKGLSTDQAPPAAPSTAATREVSLSAEVYFALFRRGLSLADAAAASKRATSTLLKYLCQFIEVERPASVEPWVPSDVYQRVLEAAASAQTPFLKPIYDALGGQVSYDMIRIALAYRGPDTPVGNQAPAT